MGSLGDISFCSFQINKAAIVVGAVGWSQTARSVSGRHRVLVAQAMAGPRSRQPPRVLRTERSIHSLEAVPK